jgi:transposase
MASDKSDDLFPHLLSPEGTQYINDRCVLRTQDGLRVVLVSGISLAHYAVGDYMAEAHAMVSLVDQGWADQNDVARAFGCSVRTLRRHQRRFDEGGLPALGRARGYPSGRPRLATTRQRSIQQLKSQGHSHYEIARRHGVSVRAVRKTLRRLGWKPTPTAQSELPLAGVQTTPPSPDAAAAAVAAPSGSGGDPKLSALAASSSLPTPPATLDTDPSDRHMDRFMARLGLLEDALPLFGSASALPRAGVLLAIPALVHSGIFECAQKIYGSLGPAFFGLRTTILILLLMALWRIKRPEALKEHSPAALGRVLGVDRAPEVKTLRRKLARLASYQRAAQFGSALAEQRIDRRGEALGFLYVDGHVRVYHGKYPLPKAHVARMRLSMPATTDYWVNDASGDPLFVVTAEVNAGLVKMLPGILAELRRLVGSRRVTIVFDRGGYSPKLFRQIVANFDFLTYRKGRVRRIPARCFHTRRTRVDGRTFTYLLADQEVRLLKGRLRLRQVTRRSDDGHQTPILTSRRDLASAQVAYWMFNRWRQENFFKVRPESRSRNCLNMKTID